jgi:excisionase family DNA binding protein
MPSEPSGAPAGLTVSEVARRYRVSADKVRAWIAKGELVAINTAAHLCGKPRWVILPDALAAFERRRAAPAPAPRQTRRGKKSKEIDYYPD